MQTVYYSLGESLHKLSKPYFLLIEKNIILHFVVGWEMSSDGHIKINQIILSHLIPYKIIVATLF